jgi:hypothetical protein
MKGTLHKTNRGWIVKQVIKEGPQARLANQYPLVDNGYIIDKHRQITSFNCEGLEVDFEILTDYDNNGPDHFPKFARIIIPKLMIPTPEEDELKDWDVTLNYDTIMNFSVINDGLENEPYISDDFQIGPDGAYEYTEEDELKDWDVTLNDGLENEPYISDDFQIGSEGAYEHANPDINYTKPGFVEKRINQMLEHLANEAFKNIGDEGLFPNHTDKDIWTAGFKAGYLKK